MEERITKIDKFISDKVIMYKKKKMAEILITDLYLMDNYSFISKTKLFIKSILNKVSFLNLAMKKTNFKIDKLSERKYVFVQMFNVGDNRHFCVLDSLIKEIVKKVPCEEILIVTPFKDVGNYYKNVETLIVPLPKIGLRNSNIRSFHNNKLSLNHQRLLSIGISLYDIATQIIKKTSPKVVFTTQDFHFYDQIFTKAANSMGVSTITHQHGMVPYPHPGLFKYVFSDFIMVWGDSTYQTLKKYISEDKIKKVGTDKFNDLVCKLNDVKKEYITVALNPISRKENVAFLNKVLVAIDSKYLDSEHIRGIIIKLHPALSHEKKRWERIVNEIIIENKLNINCIISNEYSSTILQRTKLLIACKSTLSLEAMIVGCSVIEFLNDNTHSHQNRLFLDLPESVVINEDLKTEISKRLGCSNYNESIFIKQRDVIKKEIEEFSISKEIEFILTHFC